LFKHKKKNNILFAAAAENTNKGCRENQHRLPEKQRVDVHKIFFRENLFFF
jgi:hypothetical protein